MTMTTAGVRGCWSLTAGEGPIIDGDGGTRQRVAVGGGGSLPFSHVSMNRHEMNNTISETSAATVGQA